MDQGYYALDDILADEEVDSRCSASIPVAMSLSMVCFGTWQKIACIFNVDAIGLGHLDETSDEKDVRCCLIQDA